MLAAAERSEAAAGQAALTGAPDPELVERPRRRRFSADYKLRVLRADACTRPGERYSLADPHVLAQLDRRADALVLWLLDVLAERQGSAHRDAVSEGLREFPEGKETG